jgi:hypothetical protein
MLILVVSATQKSSSAALRLVVLRRVYRVTTSLAACCAAFADALLSPSAASLLAATHYDMSPGRPLIPFFATPDFSRCCHVTRRHFLAVLLRQPDDITHHFQLLY